MIVTIWRHGQAADAPTDYVRPLSGSGEDDIGFGGQQFLHECQARNLAVPELILHSPLVRTTLTAEILAGVFSHAVMSPDARLKPGAEVNDAAQVIADQVDSLEPLQHIVLVSHQPLVSRLIDVLLGVVGRAPALSPGGWVTLSLAAPSPGYAELLFWALPPEYGVGH